MGDFFGVSYASMSRVIKQEESVSGVLVGSVSVVVSGVRLHAVTGNLSSRLKSCPRNCPFISVAPLSSL